MNQRLGKISFQSNDKADVFLVLDVWENGVEASDEMMAGINDTQFENDHAWVNGKVPRMNPVCIDGDTTVVQAWFKSESFEQPFYMTVYLECEMEEELEKVELELTEEEAEEKRVQEDMGKQRDLEIQKQSQSRAYPKTEEHFY